jgi:aspartokinase
MFQALANSGVNVDMINTSELRVNVVVDSGSAKQALASLTERFQQSIA